jgi:hypothetical protein
MTVRVVHYGSDEPLREATHEDLIVSQKCERDTGVFPCPIFKCFVYLDEIPFDGKTYDLREEALDRLSNRGDELLYQTPQGPAGGDPNMIELTELGVRLALHAGLTVDVDAYGCMYVVEGV